MPTVPGFYQLITSREKREISRKLYVVLLSRICTKELAKPRHTRHNHQEGVGMSGITYGGTPISEYSDNELSARLNYNMKTAGRNRLQDHVSELWVQIFRVFDDVGTPVTVRQMFYQCEIRGAIEKTEAGYNKVQRQLSLMRKAGILPYDFITDNTRYMRKPRTYQSLESFADYHAKYYRRDLWNNQPDYVEIWIEKEAIMGIAYEVTDIYDVPLYPCKGYSSLSLTASAAETIKEVTNAGKRAFIYYLGDYDPSGEDIPRALQKHLVDRGAEFTFTHLAVNEKQISEWSLPTRPTKKTDSRSKNFSGGDISVELDAIRPDKLKDIIRIAIERHLDKGLLERTRLIEKMEKDTLMSTFGKLQASPKFQEGALS